MERKITAFIAAAAPLVVALVAAGCGTSTSGSSYSSGPYGPTAKASTPKSSAGNAKVGVANSRLGSIVVDGKGFTLYLFEKDKNRRSACYGQCATYWLPLLTHGEPVARAGAKQSLLGTTRRANGSRQVTYAGHPLYRFVLDRKAGQANGQGLQEFGGGWDVLSPAGRKVESGG
jgi:predicted lipoprotein with Yx(FWY)xxD motif